MVHTLTTKGSTGTRQQEEVVTPLSEAEKERLERMFLFDQETLAKVQVEDIQRADQPLNLEGYRPLMGG